MTPTCHSCSITKMISHNLGTLNGTNLFGTSPQNGLYCLFHIIKKLTWVCISKYEHLSSLLCCANWALNSAASLMALFIWLATFLFSNAFWKYRSYCTFQLSQNLANHEWQLKDCTFTKAGHPFFTKTKNFQMQGQEINY